MTRDEYCAFIMDDYGISFDMPFEDDLITRVFRHPDNKKWFALVMRIRRDRIIPQAEGFIDVVNLKCAPEIMDDLYACRGVYPAYHMNKAHWLTLALDGSCDDGTLRFVTSVSYDLTRKKIKQKNKD